METRVKIVPQYGGFKIKVDGNTVAAAPANNLVFAKELAKVQCQNLGESIFVLMDEKNQVKETFKV